MYVFFGGGKHGRITRSLYGASYTNFAGYRAQSTDARLLKHGYIECVPEEEEDHMEPGVARTLARLFTSE